MSKLDIIREFNKDCDEVVTTATTIADKYTNDLDIVLFEIRDLLNRQTELSVDDLTKYIAVIPVMIYDLIDKMQVLGVRSDAAKTERKTQFNKAYITSEETTVAAKTSAAQLIVEDEQFIEDMYSRIYKLCEAKIDVAEMLHSSLKKILQWKLTELETTRNDMLANRR